MAFIDKSSARGTHRMQAVLSLFTSARSLTIVYEAAEGVMRLEVSPVESPIHFLHISYIIY